MATFSSSPTLVRPQMFQQLDQSFNKQRIQTSFLNILLIIYLPIGLVLFIIRLCMLLQALLILSIIPRGTIQRVLLRILFGVMGLFVISRDFKHRNLSARMLISNKISNIDHIVLHLVMECTTTSLVGRKPLLSFFFDHHHFNTDNNAEIKEALKQLPEFDDTVSIPDDVAVPFIAQPECMPTNGQSVLKFSSWPFTVEDIVQPVALSWSRLFDVSLTTLYSSDWTDFLWIMFLPVTIVTVKLLPTVTEDDNKPTQDFAKKTQNKMASSMGVDSCKATQEDIEMWREEFKETVSLRERTVTTGPLITESEFLSVARGSGQPPADIERMVYQVMGVLPHVPVHAARRDLMKTRSVDITVTNFLEGRVQYDQPPAQVPPTPTTTVTMKPKPKEKFSLEDGHRTFQERKKALLENARRRYIAKHEQS